jgi:uncharacterized glyoxalase superfamily protein PhnB
MTTNMTVKPIPEDYHSVTPYLTVRGAAEVIDFLKQTFKAEVVKEPLKRPDGKIMHAEVKIGDSRVMISDENEMMKATPSSLYIYVPNVDSVFQQAVKAGGKTVMEPMDMFYGDRSGSVKDSSGNSWTIATHKEDVPEKEMAKRAEAFIKEQQQKQKHRAA